MSTQNKFTSQSNHQSDEGRRARRAALVAEVAGGTRWGHPERVARAKAALQVEAVMDAVEAVSEAVSPEDAERLRAAVQALPVSDAA